MSKKDVMIKDVPLVDSINGSEKIPVSDGSNQPKTVSIEQIKSYVEHDDVNFSIDSELSETSKNPVQNKVVTSAIRGLEEKSDYLLKELGNKPDYNTVMERLDEKADKTEIPTKMSQLEQDVEIGESYDDKELREAIALRNVGAVDVEGDPEAPDVLPQGASMTAITYADLVSLRDDGGLVAGSFYRITDYITTTTQENTQSAGHPFDVIVLALNENTLAEEAYAIQSARDTDGYFAECNLSAWKLWYSLDNDSERFAWADSENGSGVIYRMIDEWNNDLPYDFKNIMFKRYILKADDAFATDVAKGEEIEIVKKKLQEMSHKIHTNLWYYGEYVSDVYPDANPETRYVPFGDVDYNNDGPQVLCEIDENNYGWFYTFHNEDEDASLLKPNVDEGIGVYDNTIKDSCFVFLVEEGTGSYYPTKINAQRLNNIVFVGNGCYSNSFGNDCYSNSFGNDCNYNSFGNDCYSNSFGNYCYSNSFGNYCNYNSFGNDCYSNSFGNYYYSNSFGNYCNYNSFGNDCYSNSFGNDCYSNSFVDDGDGNACAPAHNVEYCRLDDGVNNMRCYIEERATNYSFMRHMHIYRGVSLDEIYPSFDVEYETCYARKSNGDIIKFVLADLKAS